MIELNLPGCKLPRDAGRQSGSLPGWARLWPRRPQPFAPGSEGPTLTSAATPGVVATRPVAPECEIDRAAREAWRDPVQYRRELLPAGSRERRVLDEAAARSRWSRSLSPGQARGVALGEASGAVAACVVELSAGPGGVVVARIVAAVDCGAVIDLDLAGQEVREALTSALWADDASHDIMAGEVRVEVWWVCSDAPCTDRAAAARSALSPALENALQALRLDALRLEALERVGGMPRAMAPANR
ncbi:hypothetical protein [Rhizobacter sp. LjRoot28]|uniref:hypothetical protein n=1 Tax=Rhizobacter sp. LjRoot28 TaxID=3342309 RepID=UPI003ECE0C20